MIATAAGESVTTTLMSILAGLWFADDYGWIKSGVIAYLTDTSKMMNLLKRIARKALLAAGLTTGISAAGSAITLARERKMKGSITNAKESIMKLVAPGIAGGINAYITGTAVMEVVQDYKIIESLEA
jgi:MoaA/NifB/PqqE/SkfB family radical SAM enzyme